MVFYFSKTDSQLVLIIHVTAGKFKSLMQDLCFEEQSSTKLCSGGMEHSRMCGMFRWGAVWGVPWDPKACHFFSAYGPSLELSFHGRTLEVRSEGQMWNYFQAESFVFPTEAEGPCFGHLLV